MLRNKFAQFVFLFFFTSLEGKWNLKSFKGKLQAF